MSKPQPEHYPTLGTEIAKRGHPPRITVGILGALVLASLVVAVIALAGCGSSESSGSSVTSSAPKVTTATAAAITSSSPKPGELTGFGATAAAWNSTHIEDKQFAPGTNYNVSPALPEVNGHPGVEYQGVNQFGGRVLNYFYNFPSTPISKAKALVLRTQFPPDTHEVWFADKGHCGDMLVQSATLQRTLGATPKGDSEGTALAEFGSGEGGSESYDPSAVTNALITVPLGAKPSGPSTARAC